MRPYQSTAGIGNEGPPSAAPLLSPAGALGADVLVCAFGGVLELGPLAVACVEAQAKSARASARRSDFEFRREAERRALDHRRCGEPRELSLAGGSDRRRTVADGDVVPLHAEVLADEGCEVRERPAGLAAEDLPQRRGLILGRARVDDDADLPVSRPGVRAPAVEHGEVDAGKIGAVGTALANAEGRESLALALRRRRLLV